MKRIDALCKARLCVCVFLHWRGFKLKHGKYFGFVDHSTIFRNGIHSDIIISSLFPPLRKSMSQKKGSKHQALFYAYEIVIATCCCNEFPPLPRLNVSKNSICEGIACFRIGLCLFGNKTSEKETLDFKIDSAVYMFDVLGICKCSISSIGI